MTTRPASSAELVQIRPTPGLPRSASVRDGSAGPDGKARLAELRAAIAQLGSVVVAYSGGVDSSVVLRVAVDELGERALGVIGRSDSYAEHEMKLAVDQALTFGARIEVVATGELADPAFRSNPVDRCYHCKTELYRKLRSIAEREGAVILDGTIADDLSDWRPGRRAAVEHGVRSPLAELGFSKEDVRQLARDLGLTSHDKPAAPCLASRIPYGTVITRENLNQVEQGEALLRSMGLREVRLRHHGAMARIEVPPTEFERILSPGVRETLLEGLRSIGFRHVALDLAGFRSGSLNPEGLTGDGNNPGTTPTIGGI